MNGGSGARKGRYNSRKGPDYHPVVVLSSNGKPQKMTVEEALGKAKNPKSSA